MLFRILLLGLLFQSNPYVYSQGLQPGDTLPLTLLDQAYFRNSHRMPNLKNKKLIILDFWHHRCSACLASFPKLDSLQSEFKDSLQIILINPETKEATDRLFARLPKVKPAKLPYISGDTILHSMLPHDAAPYYVWLDNNGILLQTTNSIQTGKEAIMAYIQTGKLKGGIHERRFASNLFDDRALKYLDNFSYFSRTETGLTLTGNSNSVYRELIYENKSLAELYRLAYSEKGKFEYKRPGRVVLEVSEPYTLDIPLDPDLRESWFQQYSYTYHLRQSSCPDSVLYKLMRQDIERYFPYTATIEKRPILCYVLKSTGPANKVLATKGGKPSQSFYIATPYLKDPAPERTLTNQPISKLTSLLKTLVEYSFSRDRQRFFIDESGLIGNIDININGSALDNLNLSDLNKALATYHLLITEDTRDMEVVVIRDKKI